MHHVVVLHTKESLGDLYFIKRSRALVNIALAFSGILKEALVLAILIASIEPYSSNSLIVTPSEKVPTQHVIYTYLCASKRNLSKIKSFL
jgi:hypothetical protein